MTQSQTVTVDQQEILNRANEVEAPMAGRQVQGFSAGRRGALHRGSGMDRGRHW